MLRKIKTQAEIRKEKNRNKFLIGGVLVLLMIISTVGYSFLSYDQPSNSKVSEKGIDFYKKNGFWEASFDGRVFGFQYLPSEVSNISVEGIYDQGSYVNKVLYFVNINEGTREVLNNLGPYLLRYQEACLNESLCNGDLPIKDCKDNLIIFENSNDTRVYQNESCVYISGDSVKGADAFLYKVLKVS